MVMGCSFSILFPKFLKPFSVNSLLFPQAVTQAMYLNRISVRRAGGAQRILFKAQLLQRS